MEPLIPRHGGYRALKSFQIARLVYDVTVRFCDRYIDKRSRTHDQMVQAARSGVQNIAEGSLASGTSKKTELKLTNVARASLGELRLDYEDFLRQRGLAIWAANDPRRKALVARRCTTANQVAEWVKEICAVGHGQDGQDGPEGLSNESIESIRSRYAETAANAALVLIGVAMALLDRQLAAQAVRPSKDRAASRNGSIGCGRAGGAANERPALHAMRRRASRYSAAARADADGAALSRAGGALQCRS